MTTTSFLALCGLSVVFLVYVLVQFWREGRRPGGKSEPAIVFDRPSNPSLIVVAHPVSLSAQGGISVMPLQPQTSALANHSVGNRVRTAGKARVLEMPPNGLRGAQRKAACDSKMQSGLRVS